MDVDTGIRCRRDAFSPARQETRELQLMDPFKVPPIPNTTEFKETLEDRRSTESQSWKLLQNSEKCFLTRKLVFGCGPVLLHRKIQPPNKCNQKDKKEECCNMGLYWKQPLQAWGCQLFKRDANKINRPSGRMHCFQHGHDMNAQPESCWDPAVSCLSCKRQA